MKLRDFALECYFGKYEFTAPYLLAQSDCEAMSARELLALEEGAEAGYLDTWLGYTETWGAPALREAIAGLYRGTGPEDVLTLCGAQEGILAYMNVMLDAGDHAVIMYPNYPSVWEAARAIPGVEWSNWEVRDSGGRWAVDFDELEALVRPNTKLIAVNSPNNPTGYAFTNEELRRLCDFCRERGLYLFCDEVYKGLELDGERRDSAAELYEKAVSLGVMSKAYGLAGLRLGWMVSKDHGLLERVVCFKHYTSICSAAPSEYLSLVALRHGEALLERNRGIIRDNLRAAEPFFARWRDLICPMPALAGPVAFHRLLGGWDADTFCRLAVERRGVLLLPGSVYDTDKPYFRMGFGRKSFPENLAVLDDFLHTL
ncbi:MAG: aminotransferase class I/II-fold pyridoxal phosphate-dependent enzyme [Oscillospiraceae bacterium]|nr:aminotransferase class I/II-fold pyridoxal phosphate-dependent enzyme [Oscillospiraceae bacterium]